MYQMWFWPTVFFLKSLPNMAFAVIRIHLLPARVRSHCREDIHQELYWVSGLSASLFEERRAICAQPQSVLPERPVVVGPNIADWMWHLYGNHHRGTEREENGWQKQLRQRRLVGGGEKKKAHWAERKVETAWGKPALQDVLVRRHQTNR